MAEVLANNLGEFYLNFSHPSKQLRQSSIQFPKPRSHQFSIKSWILLSRKTNLWARQFYGHFYSKDAWVFRVPKSVICRSNLYKKYTYLAIIIAMTHLSIDLLIYFPRMQPWIEGIKIFRICRCYIGIAYGCYMFICGCVRLCMCMTVSIRVVCYQSKCA